MDTCINNNETIKSKLKNLKYILKNQCQKKIKISKSTQTIVTYDSYSNNAQKIDINTSEIKSVIEKELKIGKNITIIGNSFSNKEKINQDNKTPKIENINDNKIKDDINIEKFFNSETTNTDNIKEYNKDQKIKTNKIFWNVLPDKKIRNSLWDIKHNFADAIDLNISSFEDKFCIISKNKNTLKNNKQKNIKKEILSHEISLKLSCALKNLLKNYSLDDIFINLLKINFKFFSKEDIEIIKKIIPDNNIHINSIDKNILIDIEDLDSYSKLNNKEKFYIASICIDFKLNDILQINDIMINFQENYEKITKNILLIIESLNCLMGNKKLLILLYLILKIGNIINNRYSNSKNVIEAKGITINSLLLLNQYKGAKKSKQTLLEYMILTLKENNININLSNEVNILKKINDIDIDNLNDTISNIIEDYQKIINYLSDISILKKTQKKHNLITLINKKYSILDSEIENNLNNFINEKEDLISDIQKKYEKMQDLYSEIIKYYGDSESNISKFIEIIYTFLNTYNNIYQKIFK